jgi:arylsulfatase A-like enzyme
VSSPGRSAFGSSLVAITGLAVFAHVLLEWLFFVTKPSFLSAVGWGERLQALGAAAFPLLLAASALAAMAAVAALAGAAGRAVPALAFTVLFLLLIDNFTQTVFRFGIYSLEGPARHLYALLVAALGLASWRLVRNLEAPLLRSPRLRAAALTAVAALAVLSGVAVLAGRSGSSPDGERIAASASGRRPDILLVGSDGVEAAHLSLYGYPRPTTPFLEGFARTALVAENAFSNAANTGGSLTSILTGRLPTRTRVVCPPDILHGEDAYRHLPFLLKRLGYRTAQLSVRHYADAADLNLREGFDQANFRTLRGPSEELLAGFLGQTGGYLLGQMAERLGGRLRHVFTGREWVDPYREVTANVEEGHGDAERLAALLDFIAAPDDRPFFAHVHFMGTHGSTFAPREQRFSAGREQTEGWMTDFYDDAIADFDRDLATIAEALKRRGTLDDTLVAVYSDHGIRYSTAARVPLIIRFPGGAPAGRIVPPAQNLDIAPTLLAALGAEPPSWMEGRSLLAPPEACRPVVSATAAPQVRLDNNLWVSVPRPPFYSLGKIALLAGARQASLDLATGRLEETPVELAGRTSCPAPGPARARSLLVDHLRRSGFDVSSLAVSANP